MQNLFLELENWAKDEADFSSASPVCVDNWEVIPQPVQPHVLRANFTQGDPLSKWMWAAREKMLLKGPQGLSLG